MAAHSFLVDDTFQICGVVLMGEVTKYIVSTVLILEVVAELVWNNRSGLKYQKSWYRNTVVLPKYGQV